jgi:hypothetical protein
VSCVENVVDLSVAVRYRRGRFRGEVLHEATEQPWESRKPGEEVEHELMTSSWFASIKPTLLDPHAVRDFEDGKD